jgi:membrane-associated protease RseP (regulator of RpoE activity)
MGAVLRVEDGDWQNERTLTAAELHGGAVMYEPHGDSVTFRLEVFPVVPKTVGEIRFLNANLPTTAPERLAAGDPNSPQEAVFAPAKVAAAQHEPDLRGVSVAPLNSILRSRFHLLASVSGVVVMQVSPDSAAYEAAIQAGDVIQEVDRRPVAGVAEFEEAMRYASSKAVLLSVDRNGIRRYHAVP